MEYEFAGGGVKYLIAFDISNNRRRRNVEKSCLSIGFRVQRSVFEAFLESSELDEFESSIKGKIDVAKDSVRIYPLDKKSDGAIRIVGVGKRIENVGYKIL